MLTQLSTLFTQVITWIGEFVTALTSTDGALADLLPLFLVGIAISLTMVITKLIRRTTWGA